VTTASLDSALRTEIAAVEAIVWPRSPWMWFEDVVLRRKPSHKKRMAQAFAQHAHALAALLATASREGGLSAKLIFDIDLVLKLSGLRKWAMAHSELTLIGALRLPEEVEMLAELPGTSDVRALLTYRMVGLAKRVLREQKANGG
jgi:hypothetical protein